MWCAVDPPPARGVFALIVAVRLIEYVDDAVSTHCEDERLPACALLEQSFIAVAVVRLHGFPGP